MKSYLLVLIFLLGITPLQARSLVDFYIERAVLNLVSQPKIAPYYSNAQVAKLCEAWPNCREWALEQYTTNHSLKITKAKKKDSFSGEPRLYIQAVFSSGLVRYVLFPNSRIYLRGMSLNSYVYIDYFPD